MREIINIHIGQAGCQLANSMWELFCVEHNIGANGMPLNPDDIEDNSSSFFDKTACDKYVPRSLHMDLEPTVIDEIRTGAYRQLFHPDYMVTGNEDAANNFARGHFTLGRTKIDSTMERVRRLAEACNCLQGFVITHSYGGGTGSGFTSLLLDRASIEFCKRPKVEISVTPCQDYATAVVEPYNQLLVMLSENTDLSMLMDNQSIYRICAENLNIMGPTYSDLNKIIGQVLSSVTVPLRFEGVLNADLSQIQTNLVPYPRIHYPLIRHAPLISQDKADHMRLSTTDLTNSLFDGNADMVAIDSSVGKYMACSLSYRGLVAPKEINNALMEIKKRDDVRFVDWCPTGFKVGINPCGPVVVPGSILANSKMAVTMMVNTTAFSQTINQLLYKFDMLYNKRAFVHWFVGDGMEEGEFAEARAELHSLINLYDSLADENENNEVEAGNDEYGSQPPSRTSVENLIPINEEIPDYAEPNPDQELEQEQELVEMEQAEGELEE